MFIARLPPMLDGFTQLFPYVVAEAVDIFVLVGYRQFGK